MSYAFVYQYNHNQLLMMAAAEVECLSRSFVSVGKTEVFPKTSSSVHALQLPCVFVHLSRHPKDLA